MDNKQPSNKKAWGNRLKIIFFVAVTAGSMYLIFSTNDLPILLQVGIFFIWMLAAIVISVAIMAARSEKTEIPEGENNSNHESTLKLALQAFLLLLGVFLAVFIIIAPLALAYNHSESLAPLVALVLFLFSAIIVKVLSSYQKHKERKENLISSLKERGIEISSLSADLSSLSAAEKQNLMSSLTTEEASLLKVMLSRETLLKEKNTSPPPIGQMEVVIWFFFIMAAAIYAITGLIFAIAVFF